MWRACSINTGKRCLFTQNIIRTASCRTFSRSHGHGEKIMAIRREDINVWERRSPISPAHVSELINRGIKVLVQPSTRRAYTMDEYERAGAIITEDLSPASLIIGVKSVPIDLLLPNKTYAFFSHTIKAQEANMPLLDALLEKNIRIVDYEKMMNDKGRRVCAFGKFAGVGGMINILHGLGLRLLALGHHTPFMYMGATHNYKSSRAAKLAAYELGEDIKSGKLPKHFGALSFVFSGSGNVSQGAQEIFKELPHMYVHPHDLKKAVEGGDHRKLIGTVVSREDYLVPKAGGTFDAEEYDAHPERYRSNFAEVVAPYMSCLVNGTYWAPEIPRLLTHDDAKNLLKPMARTSAYDGCPNLPHRLLAICDISADTAGSLEFMTECTTIEYPFHMYDIKSETSQIGMAGDGVLICSIDNLPAQLPREATDYFGKLLLPWIPEMIDSHATDSFENQTHLSNTVKNAIIVSDGKLTPNFKYIADLRKRMEDAKARALGPNISVSTKKQVLVLGSGMTSGPVIEYLTKDKTIGVTIASDVVAEAEALASKCMNTTPVLLNAEHSPDRLEDLIKNHDIVVSMLPYDMHNLVARKCIAQKKNMMTSSYSHVLEPEIHQAAVDANVSIGMELGLDPGIDHMLAMECFDDVKEEGGKITSFLSYCGGIPAPECADNPLRYKFSWNARAGLMTIMHGAKYLWYGKTVEVAPGERLLQEIRPTDQFPGFRLEAYPNRDSTVYRERYNIQTADTVVRGTLRYEGFSTAATGLYKMGFYDMRENPIFALAHEVPFFKLVANMMGRPEAGMSEMLGLIYEQVGRDDERVQAIKDLGLLSDEPVVPQKSAFNTLAHFLKTKLAYKDGERDLVLLRHEIGIEWPEKKRETRSITMTSYGDPNGYSAMSRMVGVPLAIATKFVLEGDIKTTGVFTPVRREIYKPLVKKLRAEGIMSHSSSKLS